MSYIWVYRLINVFIAWIVLLIRYLYFESSQASVRIYASWKFLDAVDIEF